jgi:hypothetical protein
MAVCLTSAVLAQKHGEAAARQSPADECHQRFEAFISDLDKTLQMAKSWDELQGPLKALSPLEDCDLDEVDRISRKSRFFSSAEDLPHARLFLFDTRPDDAHRGVFVSFDLLKSPRRFYLPFAKFKSKF